MKLERLLKYVVILVITYYVFLYFSRVLNRHSRPVVVKYDPYLDRVDGVYGIARPGPIPMPYPHLHAPGPNVPYGSPEWIL